MIKLHYCISGFTQDATRVTGLFRLAERLHERHSLGPGSRVYLHPWRAQWSAIAEHAWLLSQMHGERIRIGIYAYSWGAGHGAIRLADELAQRGVSVRCMVLCDPVPRPPLLLRWSAMLPASLGRPIRVPAGVREVWSFNQRVNLPQGRRLVAAGKKTVIHPPVKLPLTHQYVDDCRSFHELALAAADIVSAETETDEPNQ